MGPGRLARTARACGRASWQSGGVGEATERKRTTALRVVLGLVIAGLAVWSLVRVTAGWRSADADGVAVMEVTALLLGIFGVVAGVMIAAMSLLRPRSPELDPARYRRRYWVSIARGGALAVVLGIFAGPLTGFVVLLVVVAATAIAWLRGRLAAVRGTT